MLAMTRPVPSSKLILVEDRAATAEAERSGPVRRYRLARLQIESRSSDPALRFEHLKRVFD